MLCTRDILTGPGPGLEERAASAFALEDVEEVVAGPLDVLLEELHRPT